MSWKSINFQGISGLDTPLIDSLNQHLEERESQLAHKIIQAIPLSLRDPGVSLPIPTPIVHLKLSEAIDAFSKINFQHSEGMPTISKSNYLRAKNELNNALREHVEMLEGCVTELFQQLDQLGIEQWHMRLSNVLGTIKDILVHKIEDLIWSIRRVENMLWKCKVASESPNAWQSLINKSSKLWTSLIDRSLISRLQHSEEHLKSQYEKFVQRYRGFLQLQDHVDKHLDKMTDFYVLSSLDRDTRIQYLKLYQLLKLWELNRSKKSLPNNEFVRALRNSFSNDKATSVLKEYYNALRHSLFEKSLYIKQHASELVDNRSNQAIMTDLIKGCETETRTLESTIEHFREFLLVANTDPYIRSRVRFSNWMVGPEPYQTKPLLTLSNDAENLIREFEQLEHGFKYGEMPQAEEERLKKEIEQGIYHLGHPLASYSISVKQAKEILDKLSKCDELGSTDFMTISYFNDTLAKLLRADWRHNVLFGFPEFLRMYEIHHHLTKPAKNRQHITRIAKFQRITKQILDWLQNHKTEAKAHDIELDINDMKVYLQDFLAYMQRNLLDFNMTRGRANALQIEIAQELLESRYLFGNFFHHLRQYGPEGIFIRKQCLFVNSYLEAIEERLHDLQHASWPESIPQNEPDSMNEEDE